MADEDEGDELAALWAVRLNDVEKLLPDDDNDEGLWAIEFELNGPGVNGSLTALLERSVDEDLIVPKGRAMLVDGLVRWLEVLARRPGVQSTKPANDG